jgi:colanic acid biosynthesis glycosyl transferase WcaI
VTAARGKRPARVFFVNRYFHPDESATSRMLSDLTFRLAAQGLPVAVLTSRQLYENPHAQLPSSETIRGVAVHRVATARLGRSRLLGRALDYLSFHIAVAWRLTVLLRPGDIVVAKTDPPLLSVTLSHVAAWRRAPLINWLQDVFPEVANALVPGALPQWIHRKLAAVRDRSLRRAAMNVVIGERMGAYLIQRGIDPRQVRVIPNCADCDAVKPMQPSHSVTRRRLGLVGLFVVGYSGNFGRAHEFETLIAGARLLINDPEIVFLMTGGGAKNAPLREAVEHAGLVGFHFQGYQPAELLSDTMAAADVHLVSLLPAIEGLILPSKVYGILAAGRPVLFIGDPAGEIARLIRLHDCGITVAVGDGRFLATALQTLQANPKRCEVMGSNARRLALTRFTSDRAASDWLEVLAAIDELRQPVASL